MNAMLKPIAQDKPMPTEARAPRGHWGFSWGRFPMDGESTEYRLFRRDLSGRLHTSRKRYLPGQPRDEIAASLWAARIELRERVDAIVLRQLGVVEAEAA